MTPPYDSTNSPGGVKGTGGQSNCTSPTAVCVLEAMISLKLTLRKSGFSGSGVQMVTFFDCFED